MCTYVIYAFMYEYLVLIKLNCLETNSSGAGVVVIKFVIKIKLQQIYTIK